MFDLPQKLTWPTSGTEAILISGTPQNAKAITVAAHKNAQGYMMYKEWYK